MDVMDEIWGFLVWQLKESIFPTLGLTVLKLTGFASFKSKWVLLPVVVSSFLLVSFLIAFHLVRSARDAANR